MNETLIKIGKEIVKELIKNLSIHGLSNSDLAHSINYQVNNQLLIIDMNEYGDYLHYGTKPHMPPVDELNLWAESKGLNAWAVAMNINKFGTKPKPFLIDFELIVNDITEEITNKGFELFEIEVESIIEKHFKKTKIK